jgi:phage gp16-like protein
MNTFALINIAKKDLGLDEEAYRMCLKRVTGEESLRVMSEQQREAVVKELKRQGWKSKRKPSSRSPRSHKAYVRLIYALWRSCSQKGAIADGSRTALRAFVSNMTEVSDPEFLSYAQATPVIEALKAMEARHG